MVKIKFANFMNCKNRTTDLFQWLHNTELGDMEQPKKQEEKIAITKDIKKRKNEQAEKQINDQKIEPDLKKKKTDIIIKKREKINIKKIDPKIENRAKDKNGARCRKK